MSTTIRCDECSKPIKSYWSTGLSKICSKCALSGGLLEFGKNGKITHLFKGKQTVYKNWQDYVKGKELK